MPVVDFTPGLRSLAAAIPDADLQYGGREKIRMERCLNEIPFLVSLCS